MCVFVTSYHRRVLEGRAADAAAQLKLRLLSGDHALKLKRQVREFATRV
jgi:hypothetical protein